MGTPAVTGGWEHLEVSGNTWKCLGIPGSDSSSGHYWVVLELNLKSQVRAFQHPGTEIPDTRRSCGREVAPLGRDSCPGSAGYSCASARLARNPPASGTASQPSSPWILEFMGTNLVCVESSVSSTALHKSFLTLLRCNSCCISGPNESKEIFMKL